MASKASGPRASQKNNDRQRTGCLIWLLLLLFTLALFVVKWDDIQKTLEATGFVEAVKPKDVPPPPEKGDGSLEPGAKDTPEATPDTKPDTKPVAKPDTKPDTKPVAPEAAPSPAPGAAKAIDQPASATGEKRPEAKPPATVPVELIRSTRVAVLYFVRVDDDGVITRHEVKRTVAASDSPMTDALEALMAGPSASELAKGLISLIPLEARLLSAQVRGSTAYLNFNEAFRYNRYGIEGYAGQLKQIVYTATGYSTVKDVQILIEGQKDEYLGGDGFYIGKPLSRASF